VLATARPPRCVHPLLSPHCRRSGAAQPTAACCSCAGTSLYVTTRHSYHLFVWLLLLLLLLKWACFEQINLGEAAIRVVL